MKSYYLLVLPMLLLACTNVKQKTLGSDSGAPVKSLSKEQLLKSLSGKVTGVQTSLIDKQYEVVRTDNDERYFIKDGRVVSSSRSPKAHERALMYWRTRFSDQVCKEEVVQGQKESHELPMRQLACDSVGMGVLYDPNAERVTRVFYYEKK